MAVMTLRNIDDEMARALKNMATREGLSVNKMILKLLRETLTPHKTRRNAVYDDLDYLAGTWTAKDAEEFANNTSFLNEIDLHLWQSESLPNQSVDSGKHE